MTHTGTHTDAYTGTRTGAWLALGRGDECSSELRRWYASQTRTLAYTGEYTRTQAHKAGRIYTGMSHNDETAQARGYGEYMSEHARNAYRPDTLVYRDGGTVLFRNPSRDVQTYSLAEARTWYVSGETVLVYRDCMRTIIEICNPTRSLTRKLKGNGKIKYFRHERGDAWREG